jgi:hypothetical protein
MVRKLKPGKKSTTHPCPDQQGKIQCFGFGSVFVPHSIKLVDPEPNSESGYGSIREKMTHKNRKKLINFMFRGAGCSLLKAEGFSCVLDVRYEGLRISKLQFLIKKNIKFFFSCKFVQFLIIRILDTDPYSA